MVSTVLIILIFALFVFLGVRRGAARTLLNLAAMIVSSFLAQWLASVFARMIYDSFIRSSVTGNIERFIAENGEQYTARHSMDALPDGVRGLVGFFTGLFGAKPEDLQGRLVSSTAEGGQVVSAIEKPLGDVTVCVISVLLMIALFFVCFCLLKLLNSFVLGFFEIPVIKQVNQILGGVLGALEGTVFILASANILYLLISYLNPVLIDNEVVFGNLFNSLILFR